MNLKEKLEILRVKNKYETFRGNKDVTVISSDEMTDKERAALELTHKKEAISTDKINLTANYEECLFWTEKKIKPFVNDDLKVIIVEGKNLVFLVIVEVKIFLEDFFNNKDSFSISLINRHLHKLIVIYKTEYYLEFFEIDI